MKGKPVMDGTVVDSMQDGGKVQDEQHAATALVERELSVLFGRARSIALSLASQVHPGLDSASYALLLNLMNSSPVRAAEVADRASLDKSTVSRQLARLEELGLVERVADPSDGRARLVQLTEVGRRRLDAVRQERLVKLRARLDTWPIEDLREFSRLLSRWNEPCSR